MKTELHSIEKIKKIFHKDKINMNITKPTSIALLTLSTLLFASCVSSPKLENKSMEERDNSIEEESTGKIIREPKIHTVVDTENE